MSSDADLRLARAAVSALEWLQTHRAPRGGAVLKHEVERLLQQCLADMDREGYVDDELSKNLHTAMAAFAEYLDFVR